MRKNAHRIQFSRPIRFLRFADRRNSRKTESVRKNSIWAREEQTDVFHDPDPVRNFLVSVQVQT